MKSVCRIDVRIVRIGCGHLVKGHLMRGHFVHGHFVRGYLVHGSFGQHFALICFIVTVSVCLSIATSTMEAEIDARQSQSNAKYGRPAEARYNKPLLIEHFV